MKLGSSMTGGNESGGVENIVLLLVVSFITYSMGHLIGWNDCFNMLTDRWEEHKNGKDV